MFAPFDKRHRKAFEHEVVQQVLSKISSKEKAPLNTFTKEWIDYATNNDIDDTLRDLAVDVSICTRDFNSVLHLTENFIRTEFFLYRAYAYSRMNLVNKIVSLKLQFQQKYDDSLDHPRNSFIVASMEFLLLYGELNYNMAITTFDEILQLIETYPAELENKVFTSLILTLGAQVNLQVSNFEKVELIARKILQYAVKTEDPYFQSVALNLLTTVLINTGEFKKAQKMLNAAIVPTETTGLPADRASLLNNAAKLELARGDFSKSIRLLEQIYELVSENPRAQAISAINVAELNILMNEIEKAENLIETALLLDKGHNLKLIEPYLLSAWIAIDDNKLDKAEEFLETCLSKLEETGETRKRANIYYFYGLLNKRKDDTDEAIIWFEKTNEEAAKSQNIELIIKSQFQMANIYLERFNESRELSDYSSILRYLDNISHISEEQFIPRMMCDLHLLRGMFLAQGGKREKAIEYILKAIELATNFNYKQMQKEANALLKQVEKTQSSELEELKELEERGFSDVNRMAEILDRYEAFKFVKTPKQIETRLHGVAIVEIETAVIKYRFTTEHELENAASLVPTIVAAVNIFSKNVLDEEITLEDLKEEGKELLIETIDGYFVVAISEKITFELKLQFEKYIDELKLKLPQMHPLPDNIKTQTELKNITEKYFTAESLELAEKDVKIEIKEKPAIIIQTKTEEVIKEEEIPVPLKVDELEVITVDTTLEETVEVSEILSEDEIEERESRAEELDEIVEELDELVEELAEEYDLDTLEPKKEIKEEAEEEVEVEPKDEEEELPEVKPIDEKEEVPEVKPIDEELKLEEVDLLAEIVEIEPIVVKDESELEEIPEELEEKEPEKESEEEEPEEEPEDAEEESVEEKEEVEVVEEELEEAEEEEEQEEEESEEEDEPEKEIEVVEKLAEEEVKEEEPEVEVEEGEVEETEESVDESEEEQEEEKESEEEPEDAEEESVEEKEEVEVVEEELEEAEEEED